MILNNLTTLNNDIDRLICLTEEDIMYIKAARHDKITQNQQEKELLIRRFESNKSLLNHALLTLSNENPGETLETLLSHQEQEALELFKQKLVLLQEVNKRYGKFVATFSEFFNTIVGQMFPMKTQGYANTAPQPAAFLQVSA